MLSEAFAYNSKIFLTIAFFTICFHAFADMPPGMRCPIIFVHGFNSSPETWGFDVGDEEWKAKYPHENDNTIPNRYFAPGDLDNSNKQKSLTAYNFAKYFNPDFKNDKYGVSKNGLECFNASNRYAVGEQELIELSRDLWNEIGNVLMKYYDLSWVEDKSKKVIIICHSQGGLLAKLMFENNRKFLNQSLWFDLPGLPEREKVDPCGNIERIITIGTPYRGSPWGDPETAVAPWGIVRDVIYGLKNNMGQIDPLYIGPSITVDPFRNLRGRFQSLIKASSNFNQKSDMFVRIQDPSLIATNPLTGGIQPWIFIRCKQSAEFQAALKDAHGFLTGWQTDKWEDWVYTGGNGGNNVHDELNRWFNCDINTGVIKSITLRIYYDEHSFVQNWNCINTLPTFIAGIEKSLARINAYYKYKATALCRADKGCDENYMDGMWYYACHDQWRICGLNPLPEHPAPLIPMWQKYYELTALNNAGDLIVPTESQSIYDIYPPHAQNRVVFQVDYTGKEWHACPFSTM